MNQRAALGAVVLLLASALAAGASLAEAHGTDEEEIFPPENHCSQPERGVYICNRDDDRAPEAFLVSRDVEDQAHLVLRAGDHDNTDHRLFILETRASTTEESPVGPAELELRTYCVVLDGSPECDRIDVRPTLRSGSQSVVGDSWIPAWFVCEEGQAPCSDLASTGVRLESEHLEEPVVASGGWFEGELYLCVSGPAAEPGCIV